MIKYFGSRFRTDGDQLTDIVTRIGVFSVGLKTVSTRLKLRIYKTGVCSKLTYRAKVWRLTPKVCVILNRVNNKMIVRITNRPIQEETAVSTRTFDIYIVRWIRARRLQWVGHILRMDPELLVDKALYFKHTHRTAHRRRPRGGPRCELLMEVSV